MKINASTSNRSRLPCQPKQTGRSLSCNTTRKFVVFAYQYRDASNYKAGGLLLLRGGLESGVAELVRKNCESATYFVAEQVGIPVLYEALYQFSDGPTDDDHVFHEFQGLRRAADEEILTMTAYGDVEEVTARFRATGGNWDYSLSPHYF